MNANAEQLHTAHTPCYSGDFCETMRLVSKHFWAVTEEIGDKDEIYFNTES